MAALVHSFPQQTSTVTMLQTRSNSNIMQSNQPQSNHQYLGTSQQARPAYNNIGSSTGYRGSSGPVQQYAFTTTPSLNNNGSNNVQWRQYGGHRTMSSPALASGSPYDQVNYRNGHPNVHAPTNAGSIHPMGINQNGSRDDSAIISGRPAGATARPQSTYITGNSRPHSPGQNSSNKATPDRYRRSSNQTSQHARSQSLTLPAMSNANAASGVSNGRPSSFYGAVANPSMDDMSPSHQRTDKTRGEESFRKDPSNGSRLGERDATTVRVVNNNSPHVRTGSSDSISSSRSSHSRPSSANNRSISSNTGNQSMASPSEQSVGGDQPRLIHIPARGSSSDAVKRTLNPSPLSKPATMANDSMHEQRPSSGGAINLRSPAAKQLAAINQKDGKAKTKTSRLRRAFSFGSAAELRSAAGESEPVVRTEPARLHKDPSPEEAYDAEQARIAEAQEAGGIGNNIYGGRFRFGSTDNLSIQSTASSASVMIRKMGRGVKKGSRSLAGLFRPKSIIGVPAAEPLAPEASEATVSMVTVEAETLRVNITAEPSMSTGIPHLERNSMETSQGKEVAPERIGSSGTDSSAARKSILGGDRERAEVLAAVRKGILKRAPSPAAKTTDMSPDLVLPPITIVSDSPISTAPSTPNSEAHGHRRTGSIAIGNEDYFMSALRLRQDTKSAPSTPHGSSKRNATFSPRLIFHDTWPPQEYDRRGEIATCNRLTPMLAQQIKEELNTFKMEMEVHENSKIYTHFF